MQEPYTIIAERYLASKPVGFTFTIRDIANELQLGTGGTSSYQKTVNRFREQNKIEKLEQRERTDPAHYKIVQPIALAADLQIDTNPLAMFSDKALKDELKRRKKK